MYRKPTPKEAIFISRLQMGNPNFFENPHMYGRNILEELDNETPQTETTKPCTFKANIGAQHTTSSAQSQSWYCSIL